MRRTPAADRKEDGKALAHRKKPYATPKVRKLGSVRELTLGGSTTGLDASHLQSAAM